jgi:hypothetical protein
VIFPMVPALVCLSRTFLLLNFSSELYSIHEQLSVPRAPGPDGPVSCVPCHTQMASNRIVAP